MFNSLNNFIKESPIFGIMGIGGGITSKLVLGKKMKVEGGIITYWGDKTVHTFLSSGILTVKGAPSNGEPMDIIVVGGGAGGTQAGGGGSSVTTANRRVTTGEFTMVVAGGGSSGGNGGQSRAFSASPIQVTVNGGLTAPGAYTLGPVGPGGPHGVGYWGGSTPSSDVAAPGVNYGGYGTTGVPAGPAGYFRSGGGAGAGGYANAIVSGGNGKQITNIDGNDYYYGGGGGGGCHVYTGYAGNGGYGGGGGGGAGPGVPWSGYVGTGGANSRNNGSPGNVGQPGGPGGQNTGGGGGGFNGYGGSGCIVVVYETP